MQAYLEDLTDLEDHINGLANPEHVRRLRAWMERFNNIRRFPDSHNMRDMTRNIMRARAQAIVSASKH